MKIALLGASGRTGQEIVKRLLAEGHEVRALYRGAPSAETHEALLGDALDPRSIDALVEGREAVICALGPVKGSPGDLCSKVTALLLDAMRRHRVRRLVTITGAMIGHPSSRMGLVYRALLRSQGIQSQLSDRREQERLIKESGLDWTILRPPRLTNHQSSTKAEVGEELFINSVGSVSRGQLAQVVLDAVEGAYMDRAVAVCS